MRDNTSPPWARRLDWALLIVLLAIVLVELTEGFALELADIRLSVRSTWRLLIWFAVLSAIRHIWWRRPSFLDNLSDGGWLSRDPALGTTARITTGEVFGVAGFFAAIVAVMAHAQLLAPLSVPDYGDPLFSIWRLSWISHTVFSDPLDLFNANIFHPEPGTLAYSDAILLPSLIAAPFFWIGVPRIAVYNGLLLAAFAISGLALYMFVSRLSGSRAAGLVSGTIFTLYPFRFEHYSHLELQMTMWMPLALWMLHRLVQRGDQKSGVALGILMAAQTLSSLYYGIYLSLYLAAVFGALVILSRARPLAPRLTGLAVAAAIAGVAVAPVAVPYVMNRDRLGERTENENVNYSAELEDYLKSHPRSWLYGSRLETGLPERCLFPGITPVVLAAVALAPPLTSVRAAYGVALFLSVDLSLGFNAGLYPTLYEWLVPLKGLRVPARFSIFVGLTLAILAGLAVRRLQSRLSAARLSALTAAAILAVMIEYRPVLTLQPVWQDLPDVYGPLVDRATTVVAVFPMADEISDNDAKYMYFSTWHWHRLVNGYSGNFPLSYNQLIAWMRRFPEAEAIEYLQQRHVEFIVLHGEFGNPEDQTRAAAALKADPRVELVGVFPARPGPSRLYRLRPPRNPTAGTH